MSATQMCYAKLWFAGQAGNWPLAAYEVDELEEGFDDVVGFHPTHKDAPAPLRVLVPAMMSAPIAQLRTAISARRRRWIYPRVDALSDACNACHQETHFGFNLVIKTTTTA